MSEILATSIRNGELTLKIKVTNYNYLNRVLRSNSYEELMWIFMSTQNPAKEITESYAAYSNLKKHADLDKYTIIHVGDGGFPRTAGLFSFVTRSENHSVDPDLDQNGKTTAWIEKYKVKKLYLHPKMWQDTNIISDKPVILVSVHGHIDLEECYNYYSKLGNNIRYIYSNPCCKPEQQTFSEKFMKENNISIVKDKLDYGILSEKKKE